MTTLFARGTLSRRVAAASLVLAIVVAAATTLRAHWRPLVESVGAMAGGPMALALALCVIHRVVNAHGWTMVVRALGHPLPTVQGARIWLASEACRWLPGSVWSYGSRGVLAARAGVPPAVAAVSLVWELVLTVLAWSVVAAVGIVFWKGPMPEVVLATTRSFSSRPWLTALCAATVLGIVAAIGSKAVGGRLARLTAAKDNVGRMRTDFKALIYVLVFYLAMAAVNGLTFWQVVRAAPSGARCPLTVVLAANSVAWLVGLFALFAPGGLVVREASIAVLLSGWMPAELAVTVALAWRAIQMVAEIAGCLVIVPWRVPRDQPKWSRTKVLTEGTDV